MLVRAGAFVPMIPDIETTANYSSDRLTLHYYADESVRSAAGTMYEDDGEDRLSLEQGKYELLRFGARHDNDALTIDLRREGGVYDGRPDEREVIRPGGGCPDRAGHLFECGDRQAHVPGRSTR